MSVSMAGGRLPAQTLRCCQSVRLLPYQTIRNASGANAVANEEQRRILHNQIRRDWKIGDMYAPHDLSAAEQRKWSKRNRPETDAFDILSLDPLGQYKNFSIMAEYVTDMGRIRPSSETGLRPVNQRKISKAIRRAIALGLMPSVHKHPEILKKLKENNFRQ